MFNMPEVLQRKNAKRVLAKKQLLLLNEQDKREILEEYWHFDGVSDIAEAIVDGEFPAISQELKHLIVATASPPELLPKGIEPLLLDWLIFKLEKVLNSYISNKLNEIGVTCEVHGVVEAAGLCPCCKYYSIGPGEEGMWEICSVCSWENGGDGPNHMSLEEAKLNFLKIGAISQRGLEFIDPEGPLKFAKIDVSPKAKA